MSKIKVVKKV